MEPRRGFEFYQEAAKQKQDEKLFLRWVHGYQTEMDFEQFKAKALGTAAPEQPQKKEETEEEILGKVKNILRRE